MKIVHSSGRAFLQPIFVVKAAKYWNGNNAVIIRNVVPLGLTNGFSKKLENHMWMVAIYTVYYNWIKIHKTLRVTPVMEAGLSTQVCTFEDLAMLIESSMPNPQNVVPI